MKTPSFQRDGDNERDQRRLEFVLQKYRAGAFQPSRADIFANLADAALEEIPPFKTVGKRVPIRELTTRDLRPKVRVVRRAPNYDVQHEKMNYAAFHLEQNALLLRMASHPRPDGKWLDGCYGSRLAWLTFVGPSPGGGDGDAQEVPRKERAEIPSWNEDYTDPCSRWSHGFQVSTQVLVETILDRQVDHGALKLFNFTNFDWMPNPNACNVPTERMRRGAEVVMNHLTEVQPRVIITMEKNAHQLLSELPGQQYSLRRPRFAEVEVLINTARQKNRYHRQMDAYELTGDGPLSGKFVLRCPQHPARIYNKDYALRVARALRTVLCCLTTHHEPILVREI